jgi:hypothetical protein
MGTANHVTNRYGWQKNDLTSFNLTKPGSSTGKAFIDLLKNV